MIDTRERDGGGEVGQRDPHPGEDEPHDVEQHVARAALSAVVVVLPEGEQRQPGELEALQAERDPHDGEAAHQAHHRVLEREHQAAAEDRPQEVQDESHGGLYDAWARLIALTRASPRAG
jgi:hypothetical protein